MRLLWMHRVSATLVRKTIKLKMARYPKNGRKIPINLRKKIQTPVGQRKMMKLITDIKIM